MTLRCTGRTVALRAGVSALLVANACGLPLNGLGESVSNSKLAAREDAASGAADADPPSSETGPGNDAGSDTPDATRLSKDATAEAASNTDADGSARDAPVTDGDGQADAEAASTTAVDGSARDAADAEGGAQPSDSASDAAPGGPPTIVLGGAAPTTKRGGAGGNPYLDVCPGSQMVIGYLGTYDPTQYLDSIQVVCGLVRVTGSSTYRIVVSPGQMLPSRGTTGASTFAARCPNNEVVVGAYGHSGLYMDQAGFDCAPLTISQNGTYAIATGAITQLPASGGPGGTAFGDPCPGGQVAVGSDIGAGLFVDSLDLVCASPMLVWPDM